MIWKKNEWQHWRILILATPAKWKVFKVICVPGSPILCAPTAPTAEPGSMRLAWYLFIHVSRNTCITTPSYNKVHRPTNLDLNIYHTLRRPRMREPQYTLTVETPSNPNWDHRLGGDWKYEGKLKRRKKRRRLRRSIASVCIWPPIVATWHQRCWLLFVHGPLDQGRQENQEANPRWSV